MAKLTVHRPKKYNNRHKNIEIYISGQLTCKIKDGETIDVMPGAGKQSIYAKIDWVKSNTINLDIERLEAQKSKAERNIERFSRLNNDYQNDIQKLKAAATAHTAIGKEDNTTTNCPICDSLISLSDISDEFEISEENKLRQELNSINRRSKDLIELIADNRKEIENIEAPLEELYKEKAKAKSAGKLGRPTKPSFLAQSESIDTQKLFGIRR